MNKKRGQEVAEDASKTEKRTWKITLENNTCIPGFTSDFQIGIKLFCVGCWLWERLWKCGGREYMETVASAQFCYVSKTTLRNKVSKKQWKNYFLKNTFFCSFNTNSTNSFKYRMLMKKKKNPYLQSCACYKFRGIKAYSQPHEKLGIILPLHIHIVRIVLKGHIINLAHFWIISINN